MYKETYEWATLATGCLISYHVACTYLNKHWGNIIVGLWVGQEQKNEEKHGVEYLCVLRTIITRCSVANTTC